MTTLQKGGLLTAYKAVGCRAASQGAALRFVQGATALVSRGPHKAAFVLPAAPKRGRSLPTSS